MSKLCLINKETGRTYDVVRFDPASKEIVLKGEFAEFTEKFDKDKFERMGYALEQKQE